MAATFAGEGKKNPADRAAEASTRDWREVTFAARMLLTGGRSAAAPSNLWLAGRGRVEEEGGHSRPWEASPRPGPAEALSPTEQDKLRQPLM